MYSIIINPIFGIEFRSPVWDVSYVVWTIVNTCLIFVFVRNKGKR